MWQLAGGPLKQDQPEGEDVCDGRDACMSQDLRGWVEEWARDPIYGLGSRGHNGSAEIGNLHALLGPNENVLGLQVGVDDV